MAYILTALGAGDKAGILEDAAADPGIRKWIAYAIEGGQFARTWAVDSERGNYLLGVAGQMREDSMRPLFCARIDGRMYRIVRDGYFSSDLFFDKDSLPSASAIPAAQREVCAALAVHGWMGNGPHDESGDPATFGIRFVPPLPGITM